MHTFTPPSAPLTGPTSAEAETLANRLMRHFNLQAVGVNVFQLKDGTFVQDYPTPENSNTNVPYPILFPPNTPISRVYGAVRKDKQDYSEVDNANPVVRIFWGSHANQVDDATAAALTSAGYGAYIT